MSDWQPTANQATLLARASMLRQIREFFVKRDVLEVETPLLASAPVTDPHLVNFATEFASPISPGTTQLYLQTSPEYAMKRLLCAGSGSIYQICKAFRNEEAGQHHNPEFTMLEWYRVGFDHWQLMTETDELLQLILNCPPADKISYQQVFEDTLSLDPLNANLDKLRRVCTEHGFAEIAEQETDHDTLLQLLFSHCIEPQIGKKVPCMVYDFPASQAALARISEENPKVSERFEVYFQGIELANGFHELADPQEQRRRFIDDNEKRIGLSVNKATIDEKLLSALESGLPDCAGIAIGLDRLLMIQQNLKDISQALSFDINNT